MHPLTKKLTILLGSLGVSFFFYKTIKIYKMRKRYRHIPGPPATGILGFYLGNLNKIVHTMNNGEILSNLMEEWVKLYGKVFKFQVLDQTIVFTIDTDGVKECLIKQNFPKPFGIYGNVAFPYNERFLGEGVLSATNQQKWKDRRAKLNPGFHKAVLKTFMNELNLKSNILMKRFQNLADGKTCVKMFEEVNHAALDIIASVAFGMDVDSINDPNNRLNSYVYEALKGFYRIQFEPFIFLNPLEWPYIYRYRKNLRKLREIGRTEISKRLDALKQGEYMADDLLTNLLKTHEKEEFDIEDLVDEFITFFVAGQETTANTLAFCFLEIARNPYVLDKLRVEVDEVLGAKEEISYEDLTRLDYTLSVYKETLRLWPPIPEIARAVDDYIEVDGHEIPKETWLQISSYVCARQDSYFKDSKKFWPERFVIDEKSGEYCYPIQNYTYFPFSLGPRSCIGQNFAQMIGKIFIAKVVKNFDITLDPTQNFGVTQVATLRPADKTRCFLTPRQFE